MKRCYRSAILRWGCLSFFSYLLVGPQSGGGIVWSQTSRDRPANYKLVPNLQPMSDNSPTPDFALPTPAGRQVALKDFRGKVVFLNFWATWCDPCREEMPAMERLYQEFKDKGLVVLAINVKDSQKKAVDFVKKLKLTYPVAFDTDGQAGLLYGAWGLPTTYLIGRGGEGLARIWGPADWYSAGARELVRALLEGRR